MGRVEGKVAFVTGAARGQGRSHAVRLAEEGADIIAIDICGPAGAVQYAHSTPEDLAETVRQVEALDRRIIAREADIRDRAAIKAAVDAGVAEFGKLDIVVANAGICNIGAIEDVTEEMWDVIIATNLTGAFNTVQQCLPHLRANGGGSIIMTSSAAGLKGIPYLSPYVASKFGVTGLAEAFAHELGPENIRVNSLHPTTTHTPMAEGGPAFDPYFERNPKARMMLESSLPVHETEPIDQSNGVLFLASDESRFVTAAHLPVDAGNSRF